MKFRCKEGDAFYALAFVSLEGMIRNVHSGDSPNDSSISPEPSLEAEYYLLNRSILVA